MRVRTLFLILPLISGFSFCQNQSAETRSINDPPVRTPSAERTVILEPKHQVEAASINYARETGRAIRSATPRPDHDELIKLLQSLQDGQKSLEMQMEDLKANHAALFEQANRQHAESLEQTNKEIEHMTTLFEVVVGLLLAVLGAMAFLVKEASAAGERLSKLEKTLRNPYERSSSRHPDRR